MNLDSLKREIEEKRRVVRDDPERYINMLYNSLKENFTEVEIVDNPDFLEKLKMYKKKKIEDKEIFTMAESAAADTGIVFFTGIEQEKLTTLADYHISAVKSEDIMPDVISAYKLALMKSIDKDQGVIFGTSSASKTADIEGKLVWGAHGPKRFKVIIIR